MKNYLSLVEKIMSHGSYRMERTGVGTRALFGEQLRFDLSEGFPLVTTKKIHWKSVVGELLWMLSGSTNNNDLRARGVTIWDEWARENGDLGPIYGKQWRSWGEGREARLGGPARIDQILAVQKSLREDPYSRRHIVTAWNPTDIPSMALAPCHCLFQFYVADGRLSCQLYQRSADVFLGVPFNIASYALLTHMMAQTTGLKVGEFVHVFGDVHLYMNHVDAAFKQLSRDPLPMPMLKLTSRGCVTEFVATDITLYGYEPHPAIKAEVAV